MFFFHYFIFLGKSRESYSKIKAPTTLSRGSFLLE
nr:MAG TPA: hypothetical protein [Caudoviricetes sp.]